MQAKDPNASHFWISMIKSIVRIIAAGSLISGAVHSIAIAGVLFLIAEILGILEECV